MKRSAGRRVGGLVAGALLVAGLTACEPSRFGAAALIDDDRLPIAEVEDTVKTLRSEQAELGLQVTDPTVLARLVVNMRLVDAVKERAAAEAGVDVGDGQVAKALDELREQLGGEQNLKLWAASERAALTREDVEDWLRIELLMQKLGEKLVPGKDNPALREQRAQTLEATLKGVAAKMRFEVNPRYGEFDPSTARLAPTSYDFLVQEPLQLPPGLSPGGQG